MASDAARPAHLTERQQKYFAAIRASMKAETGRTFSEWVRIAKSCPETKHRARLDWFKTRHRLLTNRASVVLAEAFKSESPGWDDQDALVAALWKDPGARALYEKIDAAAIKQTGAIRTARKGYTAWARAFQFAAARPVRGGVRLGLAIDPETDKRFAPAKKAEGWSERLKASTVVSAPKDVDARLVALMTTAAENS
jgi:hypothetical protein